MTSRGKRALAWTLFLFAMTATTVALVLMFLTLDRPANIFGFRGAVELLSIAFTSVGFVLALRQPDNPIGWIFLAAGATSGVQVLGGEYPAIVGPDGGGQLAAIGHWLDTWLWVPITGSVGIYVFLLFPTGRLTSRRWRWVAWVGTLGIVAFSAGFALGNDFEELGRENPFFDLPAAVTDPVLYIGALLYLGSTIAAAASLVVRFRRSRGDERQQMKWFAAAAALWATFIAVTFLGELVFRQLETLRAIGAVGTVVGFMAIPVAIGVAVLKYRLYDIDVVINRALVFGLLGAFITAVYVAIVVGIGALVGRGGGLVLPGVAAAVVALAFQPARQRARHLANRLVYGKRATPYEVLSEFSDRLGQAYAAETVLPRMAELLRDGTGALRATVWIHVGDALRPAATSPTDANDELRAIHLDGDVLPELPGHQVAVRHGDEILGALSVTEARGDALTAADERLLEDLAAQAGLVLRNVRLTEELKANLEELRASRQRIVAAQDDERRRLERNIHDGAQQQLVALAVKLRLVESIASRDPEKAAGMASEAKAEVQEALENLRDLARGIFPPLLVDQGLGAAIAAQGRKSPLPVRVSADGIGRYGQDVEAAVYFCVLEALQNAAKYSGASEVHVRLAAVDGALGFAVEDDGRGFDVATTPRGAGLQNISDRVAALGGTVEVRSEPGRGATIEGRVPAQPAVAEVQAASSRSGSNSDFGM